MSVMAEQRITERLSALDLLWPAEDRPLAADDLLRQPDDGNRYELANGALVVTPAPRYPHQRVVSRLHTLLDVWCTDDYEVLSGAGFNLAADLHRIPDLVVQRSEPAESGFLTRPPTLAVEVASRSTREAGSNDQEARVRSLRHQFVLDRRA